MIIHLLCLFIVDIYGGFITPPSNHSVRVGSTAHLDCVTNKSLPSAKVYWEKDGVRFTTGQEQSLQLPDSQLTSSSLSIPSTSFSTSGWYRCVAVNPLLPNEIRRSRSAYLKILREFHSHAWLICLLSGLLSIPEMLS